MKNEAVYSSLESTVIKFESIINELKIDAEKGFIKRNKDSWNYTKSNYNEQFALWKNNIMDYLKLEKEEDKYKLQMLLNKLNKLEKILNEDIDKNVIIYKTDHEFENKIRDYENYKPMTIKKLKLELDKYDENSLIEIYDVDGGLSLTEFVIAKDNSDENNYVTIGGLRGL